MFNPFKRSHTRYPTIREALVKSGLTAASDPALISVRETHGQFSGRRVTYFQALDAQQQLVGSGHVERDGRVVVDGRTLAEGVVPSRAPADRAAHTDDERLVFWDASGASAAAETLSAPAATWLQARSTPRDDGSS